MNETNSGHRRWSHWGMGLIVIAVGLFFLLNNLGVRLPFPLYHHWWALFILLGALPSLLDAAQHYHAAGRVNSEVFRSLLAACGPLLVASIFLLDLRLDLWWPLFVIYGGLWVLAKGPRDPSRKPA